MNEDMLALACEARKANVSFYAVTYGGLPLISSKDVPPNEVWIVQRDSIEIIRHMLKDAPFFIRFLALFVKPHRGWDNCALRKRILGQDYYLTLEEEPKP